MELQSKFRWTPIDPIRWNPAFPTDLMGVPDVQSDQLIPESNPVRDARVIEGERIMDKKGEIYLILDHKSRPIQNMDVYRALFSGESGTILDFKLEDLKYAPPPGEALVDIPALMSPVGPGEGAIYLIDRGTKRYIRNPAIMDLYGFDMAKVVYNHTKEYPDGIAI